MKFPYRLREGQQKIIEDVEKALENRTHLIFESPTGSGKTIATLYPAVKFALKNDKKVIYLVHTNSQEHQVIREAKKLGVFAVAFQGRMHMCPLAKEREELHGGSAEELALLCSKLKKDVQNGSFEACPYFHRYIEGGKNIMDVVREVHTAEEIFRIAEEMEVCPYEALKDALPEATVVVFPYIYFFYPFIRQSMLDRMGTSLQDIILIVDEAHNIPSFSRELRSMELTVNSLEAMEREALELGNPQIAGHSMADIGEFLKESIFKMEKFVQDEEGIIPQYAWEEQIAELMGIRLNEIDTMAKNIIYYGELVRENKIRRRKLPRSHIYHVGSFLYEWKNSYSFEYLRLVRWGKNPSLQIYCLDPAIVTEILRGVHTSIHLSGTLQLEEYRNLVGLPKNTMLRRYPWPFPKKNLKILYVDDVTTRYGEVEKHIERYAEYISSIISFGKSTAVFFPSYSLLLKISKHIRGPLLIEEKEMRTHELSNIIESFRTKGGALLSVLGGRIFEGLNFPGKQLEIVVIVGIPYPKPTPKTKALERYYNSKFGKGWEYAFRTPAVIKMRQAIGRLIRGPKDRGIAIILDKRAASFKKDMEIHSSKNLKLEIENFFNE